MVRIFLTLVIAVHVCSFYSQALEDQNYWAAVAREELNAALQVIHNQNLAKNVILFVGDGMDPNTVTASRIFNGNESSKLTFEEFPFMGLLKTYSVDKQVPDSASTATALFGGVKGNFKTSGVDAAVQFGDCDASLDTTNWVKSILEWAQFAGMDTGFVTTTRVTHATPSALYAHVPDRNWECENNIPIEKQHCKDIARQLIEDIPGKNIKVIMGGGRQCLITNATGTSIDPIDTWACVRTDKRNLIESWMKDKEARNATYKVVSNNGELEELDTENTDYVLGIFANGHMQYEFDRDTSPVGMPSLQQMTTSAIKILQKNPKGFILVVEGGLIDIGHHRGNAKKALHETVAMDAAVEAAVLNMSHKKSDNFKTLLKSNKLLEETLFIVTSDHGHSLTINGYPNRGNNIAGISASSKVDNIPFTTLMYATGDYLAFNFTIENSTGELKILRADPTKQDYNSYHYHQQAAILTDEAYHGGNDVAVYATGPMAHLFHSVHEQNYVAHVIAYAAKIGPYLGKNVRSEAGSIQYNNITLIVMVLLVLTVTVVKNFK